MEENSLEYDDVKSAKISTMYEDYQGVELLQAINYSRDESLLLSNKELRTFTVFATWPRKVFATSMSVIIQDSNCICQYAADTKKQAERLQVIELGFAIVDVLKKTRWAANIPLIRYSTGRKFPIDKILSRRVHKIVVHGNNTKLVV